MVNRRDHGERSLLKRQHLMKAYKLILYCITALLVMPCLMAEKKGHIQNEHKTSREFVESFYNWYAPLAQNEKIRRSWEKAIRLRTSAFSPSLAHMIEEDAAAQASCDELVGLDFDPFLYSQDPAERYEVGQITRSGDYFRAEIYRVERGRRSDKPDLTAAFLHKEGRWFFVNFYYPGAADLVSQLKVRPPCSVPRVGHAR